MATLQHRLNHIRDLVADTARDDVDAVAFLTAIRDQAQAALNEQVERRDAGQEPRA